MLNAIAVTDNKLLQLKTFKGITTQENFNRFGLKFNNTTHINCFKE